MTESCERKEYELRMPCHGVHSRLIGPVVADFTKHFVERWNCCREDGNSKQKKLEVNIANVDFFQKGIKSNVQVLRSASNWSVGIKEKENSILQGYYKLIDDAKHYLYIENQFFISRAFNEEEETESEYALSNVVKNLIAYHIRKRIERAYYSKEKFRVFVFIPLLPGFPGEPDSNSTFQLVLNHTYAGISRNHGMSIIEQLEKIMGDQWKNYIGFYSLRGHGLVNGEPRTE
jgi:phospholipase D1/2